MAIGQISVDITANTTGLSKGTKRARKDINGLNRSIKSAINPLKLFAGVLAGLGAASVVSGLRRTAESIDHIAKTSDKLGVTTEALVGLHRAAELTGVSTKTFDMAMQRAVRRVAEAAKGTGEARDAIKELGLSATELSGLAPDVMFGRLADAMSQVSNQGDRVRLSMKLFDSEGVALVNTLAMGSRGLAEARKEAEKLGETFSRDSVTAVMQFNDAMRDLKAIFGGKFKDIVIDIAPAALKAVNDLKLIMENLGPWADKARADPRLGPIESVWKAAKWAANDNPFSGRAIAGKAGNWLESQAVKWGTIPGKRIQRSERMFKDYRDAEYSQGLRERSPWGVEQERRKQTAKGLVTAGKGLAKKFVDEISKTKHLARLARTAAGQAVSRAGDALGAHRDRNDTLRSMFGMFGLNAMLSNAQTQAAASGPRGPSAAIRGNTLEGFSALRANMRGGGKTDVKDILRKQLDAMKGENGTNGLLKQIIDLFAEDQGITLGIEH